MGLKEDLQSDFNTILDDFGVSTTIPSVTGATVSAVRNSLDKEIAYMENANKSVEYKFTLWYDVSDITAAGGTVPEVNDEIVVDGLTHLVVKRTYDPLQAIVALDMAEQYG